MEQPYLHDDFLPDEEALDLQDEADAFIEELDEELLLALEDTDWQQRVGELTLDTPLEERVALYQQIRNAGVLPDEATFFLIAWALQEIASERVLELFDAQYAARFARMEEKYHIDPSAYIAGELPDVPQEYEALNLEFNQAAKSLHVATMQTFGEHKMASLHNSQPETFNERYFAGEAFFLGEEEEDWQHGTDFHD